MNKTGTPEQKQLGRRSVQHVATHASSMTRLMTIIQPTELNPSDCRQDALSRLSPFDSQKSDSVEILHDLLWQEDLDHSLETVPHRSACIAGDFGPRILRIHHKLTS